MAAPKLTLCDAPENDDKDVNAKDAVVADKWSETAIGEMAWDNAMKNKDDEMGTSEVLASPQTRRKSPLAVQSIRKLDTKMKGFLSSFMMDALLFIWRQWLCASQSLANSAGENYTVINIKDVEGLSLKHLAALYNKLLSVVDWSWTLSWRGHWLIYRND